MRYSLFGCHICVVKRILGGKRGNSGGNESRALRSPPSLRYDRFHQHVFSSLTRVDALESVGGSSKGGPLSVNQPTLKGQR